jgi:long-chain fatty acid transport protein
MRPKALWIIGLATLVSFFSGMAWAAGTIVYEVDSPSTGTASAGWAALAKDAATAFQNPAGMTRLDRSQLLVGVQPLIITSKFNAGPGTSVTDGGDNGGNAGGVLPSGGGYYVYSASDRLKLGLSVLSYFGAALDYGDSWVGRYRVEKTAFITSTFAPSLAYRVNNWLSIGALLNITYGYFKTQTGVNNLDPRLPDGQVTYKDTTTGVGGGAGVMIEPTDSTRFGLVYYSPVSMNFQDTPSFSGLGPVLSALFSGRPLGLTYTLPQWLMVSGYQQVTDNLAIMANLGWQNWHQFGSVDVSLQADVMRPTSMTTNLNLNNTWHGALGMQYRIGKPWLLSLGFAYDSSPMDETNRSPSLPFDRNWRGAAGIQYDWSPNLTLGFAYEYINLGSDNINKSGGPVIGSLVGDYGPNNINVINLNAVYKF